MRLVSFLVVSLVALAPPQDGAADEPGHRLRVTVDGGRVSIFAEAAPIPDIVRAMADRTGVEISAVNAGAFAATVTVEQEPLDRALVRVLGAVSPAANVYTVFSYDGDRLRAVKVVFRPKPGSVAEQGALIEDLRRAGVAVESIDLVAAEELAEAGVSLPEILDVLRSAAWDPASESAETVESATAKVSQPLSEVDRQTLSDELRAGGVPEKALDEGLLLAARQLRSDGVPLEETVETLSATLPREE
jgi:hypothetical protein